MRIDIGSLCFSLEGLGETLAAEVRARYQRFLCEGPPDVTVVVTEFDGPDRPDRDPEVTRAGSGYQIEYGSLRARFEGSLCQAQVVPSIWAVDSLLRIVVGLALAERGGLLVHGSAVRVGDRALVCFGPSGVGKTTVAQSVSPGDVFCDEMIALTPDGRAWGTPFHGDYPVCAPLVAPVLALVRLVQGPVDHLEVLSKAQAAQALLNSTLFFSDDDELAESLLTVAVGVCARGAFRLIFQRGTHVPTFVTQRLPATAAGAQAARQDARG